MLSPYNIDNLDLHYHNTYEFNILKMPHARCHQHILNTNIKITKVAEIKEIRHKKIQMLQSLRICKDHIQI